MASENGKKQIYTPSDSWPRKEVLSVLPYFEELDRYTSWKGKNDDNKSEPKENWWLCIPLFKYLPNASLYIYMIIIWELVSGSGHLRHDYLMKYAYFAKCYLERFASTSDILNVAQRKKKKKKTRETCFQIIRGIASSMTSQNTFS